MQREQQKEIEEGEEERDEWFESIKDDQAKMLLQKSQRQNDSDVSESEDEDGDDSQLQEDLNGEERLDRRETENEIRALKKSLVELLEPNENANQAMQRLKTESMSTFTTKKKNVRSKPSTEQPLNDKAATSNEEKKTKFNSLVAITTRLQQLGYTEVFSESCDDIAYELKQHALALEREKARLDREVLGWYYKILQKESGTESEPYGPFTQIEMVAWNEGGFFKESDSQFCTFIKAKEYQSKKD